MRRLKRAFQKSFGATDSQWPLKDDKIADFLQVTLNDDPIVRNKHMVQMFRAAFDREGVELVSWTSIQNGAPFPPPRPGQLGPPAHPNLVNFDREGARLVSRTSIQTSAPRAPRDDLGAPSLGPTASPPMVDCNRMDTPAKGRRV